MLGLPSYGTEATSSGLKDPEVAHVLLYKWDCPKHRALASLVALSMARSETLDWHHRCFKCSQLASGPAGVALTGNEQGPSRCRSGPSRSESQINLNRATDPEPELAAPSPRLPVPAPVAK